MKKKMVKKSIDHIILDKMNFIMKAHPTGNLCDTAYESDVHEVRGMVWVAYYIGLIDEMDFSTICDTLTDMLYTRNKIC